MLLVIRNRVPLIRRQKFPKKMKIPAVNKVIKSLIKGKNTNKLQVKVLHQYLVQLYFSLVSKAVPLLVPLSIIYNSMRYSKYLINIINKSVNYLVITVLLSWLM